MANRSLRLIHCSDDVEPRHRKRSGGFRPLVIQGSAQHVRLVPRKSSLDATLELIDLGFLVAHVNYLAFLRASTTILAASKSD